ncbi:cation efflux protein [Gaertneriomyces semiglobifer]|nr:cation efflux protein [Gaertneriomyces semiglobifer]
MTTNGIMFLAKLYAAIQSGSASMFSEALHSLADVVNESLLFVGIHRSLREPDPQHPYGFTLERYAWALVSGVGIFFLGGGVSLYHGFAGLLAGPAHVIGDPTLSWAVLSCSLAFELGTMRYAYLHIKETATAAGQSVWDYIKRGADPTAVQIFLEDCAAVGGLALAGGFLTASKFLNLPWLDSLGSISIGLLLSGVAMFLIRRNIASLIGTRMRDTHEDSVVRLLERDPIISRVHDVKTTMLAPNVARFKAEILVDGQEVTRRYISQCEGWEKEVEVFQTLKTRKEIEEWTIRHGGGIVNTLGAEVDRLEMEIMRNRPEVKHIDLEI